MAATREEIAKLYVATFDRAADADGLAYWISDGTDATTSLTDLEDLASAMTGSAEYQALYDGMDREGIVTAMYNNLFDRAPDAEGLDYWVNGDGADIPVDKLIIALINGAQGDDITIMDNKAAVGLYFADQGLNDLEAAKTVLDGVTADPATVEDAKLDVNDIVVENSEQTYSISTDASSVVEGNVVDFTVSLGLAVSTDTVVNYQIQGAEVAGGTATPIDDLGILNGTVTIPAGETSATISLTPTDDGVTEGYEGFKVVLLDSDFNEIAASGDVVIEDPANAGQSFTLTTGVDSATDFTGGAGDDTFIGVADKDGNNNIDNSTWSVLDAIDGGAGEDTFDISNIGVDAIDFTIGTISNIETINVQSIIADTVDVSSISGLETVNVTKSAGVDVTAADTTDVNVSGATGAITVDGGKDVAVTDETADTAITIGGTTAPAGTVTVTDSDQGAGAITISGGTDATVTTTVTTGTTTISGTTGNVVVNATAAEVANAGDLTMGAISISSGSSVDVTVSAGTTDASEFATPTTVTQSAVGVVGDGTTTDVTITQDAAATAKSYVEAVEGVAQTQIVTFEDLDSGSAVTVDGLTFTASQDLTAEEVAAVFANLAAGATQSAGGVVANGVFTNAASADWTTGAADGATVTYTETVAGSTASVSASGATVTQGVTGVAEVDGVTGVLGVANGDVSVSEADETASSITTVTLDGFADADLGVTGGDLNALTTLSLANSAGDSTVATDATTLDLSVNNISGTLGLDETAPTIADLTITTTGEDSAFALTAAAVETLTVDAAAGLDITGSTLSALTDATVTGAGDVNLGDISATVETLDASASTGAITATVAGDTATVTTGAGDDTITTTTAEVTEDIDLAAGDDTFVLLDDSTTVPTATVKGGDGTDTVSMTYASADAFDANTDFVANVTGFEHLTISDAATDGSTDATTVYLDLANLSYNYVTVNGTLDGSVYDTLAMSNAAADTTIAFGSLAAAGDLYTVALADATGSADSITYDMSTADDGTDDSAADLNAGTITADGVETFNINANTTDEDGGTMTIAANGDSVTTINVSGAASATVTSTATTLTTVDASGLTDGVFTFEAANDSMTITGGAGDDVLTATGSQDILLGGAGDDTLTGADLTTLTGGEGNDTFVMNTPSSSSAYSTITDLSSGDIIDFNSITTSGLSFVSSAVVLADTAVFQDYANAAVNQLADTDDDIAWFQYDGNTYIVANDDNSDATDTGFEDGIDSIIRITGLVDLDTGASYNETSGTLDIA